MTDFPTNPTMTEANPFLNFTDADLKAALRRAMRSCIAMGVILSGVLAFVMGWRVGASCLAGTLVSAISLYQWQQLIAFVNARLDKQKPPRSTAWVVTMFFLHMGFAALVIYVSLRHSSGVPYALIAGLGLAVLALTVEAVRLIRS
jgi:hypothetical protein